MAWEVEYTDEFGVWWDGLVEEEQDDVAAAVRFLEEHGPALGRPFVDTIHGSRHANLKELRPQSSHIRVLFAFDPRRMAILLIGGGKTHRWNEWYSRMIPIADQLSDEHIETLRREGLI